MFAKLVHRRWASFLGIVATGVITAVWFSTGHIASGVLTLISCILFGFVIWLDWHNRKFWVSRRKVE